MKKKDLIKELSDLEGQVVAILKVSYKVQNDTRNEARLVFLSDHKDVAKQIMRVLPTKLIELVTKDL